MNVKFIKLMLIGMCILIFSSFALANCQKYVDDAISNKVEVPKLIPYKNEIFNFYMNDSIVASAIIRDRKLLTATCNESENPTYNIFLKDWETVEKVSISDKPVDKLNELISKKDIDIKGVGFSKKFKGFFTKLGLKVASIFI